MGLNIGTFVIKKQAGRNNRGYALWQGICKNCGAERIFSSMQLKAGTTKPCDCEIEARRKETKEWYEKNNYLITLKDYLVERVHHSWHLDSNNLPPKITLNEKREDLSGQVINNIQILYPCGYNIDRRIMYVCKCFCGTYFISNAKNLKLGITRSCDCLRKEHVIQTNMERTEDIIGKTFGKLTVLKFMGFTDGNSEGKRKSLYLCRCGCGRECIKQGVYLRCGDTQTCGLCANSHGEIAVANYLTNKNIKFISQYSFDDCRNDATRALLYFDFAIIDEQQQLLGLIEYDGEQHYNPNLGGWFTGTYDDLHRRDIIKDNYCQTHNYKLYRIRYDEDVNKRMEEIISELRC